MAEYIDREKLIPDRCYYEPYGYEAISCEQIFHEDVADVVEREKIDKAIEEISNIDWKEIIMNYDDVEIGFKDKVEEILKRNIGE